MLGAIKKPVIKKKNATPILPAFRFRRYKYVHKVGTYLPIIGVPLFKNSHIPSVPPFQNINNKCARRTIIAPHALKKATKLIFFFIYPYLLYLT